jgi:hypothetical protein
MWASMQPCRIGLELIASLRVRRRTAHKPATGALTPPHFLISSLEQPREWEEPGVVAASCDRFVGWRYQTAPAQSPAHAPLRSNRKQAMAVSVSPERMQQHLRRFLRQAGLSACCCAMPLPRHAVLSSHSRNVSPDRQAPGMHRALRGREGIGKRPNMILVVQPAVRLSSNIFRPCRRRPTPRQRRRHVDQGVVDSTRTKARGELTGTHMQKSPLSKVPQLVPAKR